MAGASYLKRIAHRATQDPTGVMQPQRMTSAIAAAPDDAVVPARTRTIVPAPIAKPLEAGPVHLAAARSEEHTSELQSQ